MTDDNDRTVFIDMLLDKMAQGDIPQPVIDLVAGNSDKICTDYEPSNPQDTVILNNKLIHLREVSDQARITDGNGPVKPPLSNVILQVLRSKS